jgi:ADP-ribosylation factor GTPase-activating protein 1
VYPLTSFLQIQLDAAIADRPWAPSAPPATFSPPSERPSSAQGLRKSRASARAVSSNLRSDSASPSRLGGSRSGTPDVSQKNANETYFSNLGQINASRSADLPPSQGGRYQGFGNTPTPPIGSDNPSWGMSSANAPTMRDFQDNPMGALSKGWSLFSSAVVGASRAVNDNVIQPGMEKVNDPNFQANVKGYLGEAQRRATEIGSSANEWSKHQFGVDVAQNVGNVVGGVKDRIAGPDRTGYNSLSTMGSPTYGGEWDDHGSSALYGGGDHGYGQAGLGGFGALGGPDHPDSPDLPTTKATSTTKKSSDNWDDEWKDF